MCCFLLAWRGRVAPFQIMTAWTAARVLIGRMINPLSRYGSRLISPIGGVGLSSLHRASTLSSILSFWTEEFSRNGVSEPSNSAELILAHVLGRKTLEGTSEHQRMSSAVSTMMTTLAMQRMDGIPVQYVIGEWDFRHVTLEMKSPVFIPRPETEQLVGFVIDDIKGRISQRLDDDDDGVASSSPLSSSSLPLHVLEIGCGSGAISLSLVREISQDGGNDENDDKDENYERGNVNSPKLWRMSAIDVGEAAIDLTLRNARRLKFESELELRRASVCDVIEGKCHGRSC